MVDPLSRCNQGRNHGSHGWGVHAGIRV